MDKKKPTKDLGREAGSLVVFALGLFTLLALITFHPHDPSVFSNVRDVAHNACGKVGALFASSLLQFFGLGAFLAPAGFFFVATTLYQGESSARIFGRVGGIAVTTLSLSVFLTLQFKYWPYAGTILLTGGAVGVWVAGWLEGHLNAVGASIASLLMFALTLAVATPLSVAQFGARILKVGGLAAWRGFKIAGSLLVLVLGFLGMKVAQALQVGMQHFVLWAKGLVKSALEKRAELAAARLEDRPAKREALEDQRKENAAVVAQATPVIGVDADGETKRSASARSAGLPTKSESRARATVAISAVALADDEVDEDEHDDASGDSIESIDTISVADLKKEIEIAPLYPDHVLQAQMAAEPAVAATQKKVMKDKPKRARGQFKLPTIEFLKKPPKIESSIDREKLIENSAILVQKLADFGIEGEVTAVRPGPVITLYEFKPAPGVKVSRISALADDLSMALSAESVRILAPLPGKSVVGIEIPSENRETVYLREFLQNENFYTNKHQIPVAMGKDIGGQTNISDLARMPHLLVAGQTGSGKSVFMNGLICSLLYRFTPDELRMILVDPKFIEFRAYQDIPHLLLPVVDDAKQAAVALKWAVREMERRYRILAKLGARNLAAFNQKVDEMGVETVRDILMGEEESENSPQAGAGSDWIEAFEPDESGAARIGKLPYVVVIIDELADLMMIAKKEVEISIARIAQKARAAGIHLVIATQRPSTDVITGLIKANLPSRASFQLSSFVDSKTILDRSGAERLLGQGDMLFIPPGVSQPLRLHGAYVDDDEIHKITSFIKDQGKPAYRNEILSDEGEDGTGENGEADETDALFDDAVDLVKRSGHASASFIQRHLKVGYNRAARMIEEMESRGIVGPAEGARPREVLIR